MANTGNIATISGNLLTNSGIDLSTKADLVGGLVPSSQLPSYVDDVLEYANLAALPATGEAGKIYVAIDTNKIYRWSGSVYTEVSPTVGTVWGGIGGTLSNQTDLQTALDGKQASLSGTGFVKSTAGVISYDTNTYLTGITSSQVTTALGFTPYDATNPSGYITSSALSAYVPITGASYIQSTGRSSSYGSTNGTSTGAFNAIMGTSTSATWLISGTSAGVFRGGIQLLDAGGVIRFYEGANFFSFGSNTITATTFSGALSGNATTATTLATARTLTIGSTGKTFNGSADVSWTLAEIGVLNTVLTPYAIGANTAVTTSDTIETAIEKLQGQVSARQATLSGTGYVKMAGTTASYVAGATAATANTVVERDASGYITANQFSGVNTALNTSRSNLGDPTTDEKSIFHGQFNNKFRFIAPTSQEESTDGTNWTASTRATANQLVDMMIGEGQGTSFNAIPTGTAGTYGGYRLTWDVVATTGYIFLNQFYAYCSTQGNDVTFLIEAFHNTNGWSTVASGVNSVWPGHVSIRHSRIEYNTNVAQIGKVRVTFSTTRANTNTIQLYAIEWFGGYPQGRRNVESYDRLKNVTFPAAITGTSIIRSGGTAAQFLKADGSVDSNTYVTGGPYLPLSGGTLTGALSGTSATFSAGIVSQGAYTGFQYNSAGAYPAYNTYFGAIGTNFSNSNSELDIWNTVGGGFVFRKQTGASAQTALLTIASSGAATFSSSVTASGGFEIPNGQFYRARRSSGNLLTDMIGIPSGTDDVRVLTTGDFNILNGSLVNILAVKNGGNVLIGTTTDGGNRLEVYGSQVGLARFVGNQGSAVAISLLNNNNNNSLTSYVASSTAFGITDWINNAVLESNTGMVYSAYGGNHIFETGSSRTERMRITSGGQLKLNTYLTATSWSGTAAGYLAFDSSGNVITVAGVAATDNTKLPLAGGTMTGQLIIGTTGIANSPSVRINTSSSASFVHTQENFAANLTAGQRAMIFFGKVGSTKNAGGIGYYWAGDASNSNFITLGHWGNDDLLRVYGDGVVQTTGYLRTAGVTSNAVLFNAGASSIDFGNAFGQGTTNRSVYFRGNTGVSAWWGGVDANGANIPFAAIDATAGEFTFWRNSGGTGGGTWTQIMTMNANGLAINSGYLVVPTIYSGGGSVTFGNNVLVPATDRGFETNSSGGISLYSNEINAGALGGTGDIYLGWRRTNTIHAGTNIHVGSQQGWDNPGGWNKNILIDGTTHGRFRIKASNYTYGNIETYLWADSSVSPSHGIYGSNAVFSFNGSITSLTVNGQTVIHTGNIGSQSVSNATTLGGYAANQSTGANTIVQRDANGYIQNSYFYTSGGGAERGTGISYIAGFNSSDYYIRSYTLQGLASAMSGATMNINGSSTSCTGNAATAYGWSNTPDSWYGIGQTTSASGATAVGGYYPWTLSYHTGLALSAHSAYGGIRFYNQNYPTGPLASSPVMQIINGGVLINGSAPLTTSNYTSYALSTGGGTTSGTITANFDSGWGFRVNRSSTSAYVGIVHATGGTNNWYIGQREDGTSTYRIYNFQTTVNAFSVDQDGNATANGSLRAPIFYDSNDTGYFLDPSTPGTSLRTAGSIYSDGAFGSNGSSALSTVVVSRTFSPKGGAYSFNGGNITGAIKIRLPFRGNDSMWTMTVRIYNYSTNQTSEYLIGNYSYSAGSWNPSASCYGGASASMQTVRFGNEGGYDCIWIGETSTVWSYPVVSVMDFTAGYANGTTSNYISGWDVNIVSAFGTVAGSISAQIKFGDVTSSSITTSNVYTSSDVRGLDVYTTGGWFRNHTNNNGIYWSNTGWHFYPENASDFQLRSGASDASIHFLKAGGTAASYIHNDAVNNIGFLSTGRSWTLRVDNSGNTTATGDVTAYSDRRIKENILQIDSALSKVLALSGYYYNRTDTEDKSRKVGFIAQEVLTVVPEIVNYDDKLDRYSVSYGNASALLVEAIKEQQVQIDTLQAKLDALLAKL
jgi:hypothetical protein